MTEQKRPVLTLKRKTDGEAPARSRKTIINVTTPPKWKVKKQQLADRAVREASLAEKSPGKKRSVHLPAISVSGGSGQHAETLVAGAV